MEDLLVEVTELRLRGDTGHLREREALLRRVQELHEFNPMLGLRGCRLGILYPEINEMQVRAILQAAIELKRDERIEVIPEIMIPLVGHPNELQVVHEQLQTIAAQVIREAGVPVRYMFGTMIEIPRACLVADQIAQRAEFFSFGTNDLTQTIFGFSRDDAQGKFLHVYLEKGILKEDPFQTLDQGGVGQLMEMGAKLGKSTRPKLEVGICGEHGGDPASVEFCHRIGLDYVSCSPFRVPVARLAAAQARGKEKLAVAKDVGRTRRKDRDVGSAPSQKARPSRVRTPGPKMSTSRQLTEQWERERLSSRAARAGASRGREVAEPEDDLRTGFQRDRDRIIHSKAFRRLTHKTQVFIAPEGDHYRTRLTHTLEVAQAARTAARALRLNEDLTEAIALAHDLGHPPFGHAGEEALNEAMQPVGGFRHYAQSLRVW